MTPWLSNRLPHSCRASHTAVMLSFFLFFLLFLFLLLKDLAMESQEKRANRIHSTAQFCEDEYGFLWLVQQHSDNEHGMPAILMSCDAKEVSPKTLMKLIWSNPNVPVPKTLLTMPQVERPVAQCAEVLLGQGHIWSAPAEKKTSSNGTEKKQRITCWVDIGTNQTAWPGLFMLCFGVAARMIGKLLQKSNITWRGIHNESKQHPARNSYE